MGFSKSRPREGQNLHFDRDSIPMQGAISWVVDRQGVLRKDYWHHIGHDSSVAKGPRYTSMINKMQVISHSHF